MTLNINFDPFPELFTKRLFLRRITIEDADEMFRYRSDKQLMRYIPHRLASAKSDIADTIKMVNDKIENREGIHWAITLMGNNTIIGTVGFVRINEDHLRAELGYMLHSPFHGKGIMQEACKGIMDYGYNVMKLHSIEAIVNCENTASKKVLESLGFTNDAFFRDYLHHNGTFINANVYSHIKEPC